MGAARPEPLPLTEAQTRVLRDLSHGLRFADIGRQMELDAEYVKDQARQARARLAAKTTVHAVAVALRRGLIQ